MRIVVLLLVAALSGCFTVAGGVIGSRATSSETTRMPDGTRVTTTSNNTTLGIVVGLGLDALTLLAVSQAISHLPNDTFTTGPGEGEGPSLR